MNEGSSHSDGESVGDKIDVDSALDSDKVILEDRVNLEAANEKANVLENEVIIPEIGMQFDSVEEMFQFFKKYAKHKGFAARKRTSKKDEEGHLRSVTFACTQGGKTKRTTMTPLLPQPTNESGCNVKLTSSFGRDGKWRINSLILEHNHDLSPSKAWLFRFYREIDEHVKRQLEVDDIAGIGPQKSYNALIIEAGGHEKLPFIEKDCRNRIDKGAADDATQVTSNQLRYKKMCAEFSKVADLAADDEDCCILLMEWIENKKKELYSKKYHVTLKSTVDEISPLGGSSAAKASPKVQDPKPNRAKGRRHEKRFKAPMEENSKNSNKKAPESENVQDCTKDPLPVQKKPKKARTSSQNISSSENVKDGSTEPSQQLGVVPTQESVVLSQNLVQQSPCLPPVNGMGHHRGPNANLAGIVKAAHP